jgi:Rho guanine nucleotide exchange factor 4
MYCRNYKQALHKLEELLSKKRGLQKFLDQAATQPLAIENISLDFLLITPIQRIPRLILLLNSLVHYTTPDHTDFNDLKEASTMMQEIADFVNESIGDAERMTQGFFFQEI